MGHYSILNIGKESLEWKYKIPDYLSFLFEQKNLYLKEADSDEGFFLSEIGYKTNCINAIRRLDHLGFDWAMIVEVYDYFSDDLMVIVREDLVEEFSETSELKDPDALDNKVNSYLKSFAVLSFEEQLKDFCNFLPHLTLASKGKKSAKVKSIDGKIYHIKVDPQGNAYNSFLADPLQYLFERSTSVPPWILAISNMFDYDYREDFSEIIMMVQIKLMLEAERPESEVILRLEDMIEDRNQLDDFHQESANSIVEKIDLYNKFFHAIIDSSPIIKESYFKKGLKTSIEKISSKMKSDEKGKALEDLMVHIFESIEGIFIQERRLLKGNEEIDLVLKNKINDPFWISFSSPLIFVECKNWKTKIGAKEIRDFAGKISGHRATSRLGFLISFNGFTREAISQVKLEAAKDCHIVRISKVEIEALISSKLDTQEWLEQLIGKLD